MNKLAEIKGVVTDIQRFSVHDGMGIRTIVFLKGCPLNCQWCHNPETNTVNRQLMIFPDKCIGCGECLRRCPEACISADGSVDRGKCTVCGLCADICCTGSKRICRICGDTLTAGEVIGRVKKDMVFYNRSDGGLTLSGGEPTASPEFALALLQLAKENGINTAVETSGYCEEETFRQIMRYTDMVLFDMKHTDPQRHKEGTGVENALIMKNLYNIAKMKKKTVIRYPLIPDYNDDEKNLLATAEIAGEVNALEIHVLPFHQLGAGKWVSLDKPYSYAEKKPPARETIDRAVAALSSSGLPVNVNGYGELTRNVFRSRHETRTAFASQTEKYFI